MPRWTTSRAPCHRRRRGECGGGGGDCAPAARPPHGCRRRTACAGARTRGECSAAAGCAWRRWGRTARAPGCYADGSAAARPPPPPAAPVPRRVVAYSLFWGAARGRGHRGRRHPLREYAHGLWRNVRAARDAGWLVHVYHDGTAEPALRRCRAAFPPSVLRCVRVDLAPDLRGRWYLGCLFRLLAADDPAVDVFLSRDLDDALDPAGLRLVESRWLGASSPPAAAMHIQAERYDTPFRTRMANLGWFGQRNDLVRRLRPTTTMAAAIAAFARADPVGHDRYTADEEFLTDVWIPAVQQRRLHGGGAPLVARVPSHAFRQAVGRRRTTAWRQFQAGPLPPPSLAATDATVRLGW